MRSPKLPIVALSLVALSACESSKPPRPEPRTIALPSATPPAEGTATPNAAPPNPVPTASSSAKPTASSSAKPTASSSAKPGVPTRKIHPLSPDMPSCLEMYSVCKPSDQGPLCTSAPFHLSCGEVGTVPGGDTLECVCP